MNGGNTRMVERRADRSGQVLGPYQLTRLLGAGGFGEVYEANHRLLQQKRAIKLLLERHFHDPTQRERFLREARTLATLEHSNILPVLEVGEEGTILYLVMPFYRRGTLNDLLKQRTTSLPLAEVERLLVQMCAAVGYAHVRQIAHLDLKPENMLLHEDGRLVLSDFGLAHLIKQGRLEAGSSASWGTPYYMAPEQIRGEPELRSDLYALGVILYQLLTNQRPFTGNAPEAVMMKHLLEAPPPLHVANPQALVTLEPMLRKALEKRPEDRYPTAEALLADFRRAVGTSLSQNAQSPAPNVSPISHTQSPDRPVPTATSIPSGSTPQTAQSANMLQPMGRGCEIPLNNGYNCGVTTKGRCATCGRAFCASHQARSGQIVYIDQCAPCLAKARADEEERNREYWAKHRAKLDEAREYLHSGAARTALLTSGVQPVNIYQIQRKLEKKFFSQSYRTVEVITSIRRGWILGDIAGEYRSQGEVLSKKVDITLLTALLDHDQVVLTPVRFQSERYEEEDNTSWPDWKITDNGWIQAAQAVRRLIERYDYSSGRVQIPAGRLGFIRIEEGKEPGRVYEIKGLLSIGQSEENDIVLHDTQVSRVHATIINQGNGNYALRDEGAVVVTTVNWRGLGKYQLHSLKDGDRIQLGQTVFVFGTK
jgi:serine/threonine protein kinase/pSer/pThr/pTyr-binding forkhead associated (FHA) protein